MYKMIELTRDGVIIFALMILAAGCSMSKYGPGKRPALTENEKAMGRAIEQDLKFLVEDVGSRNAMTEEKYLRLCKSANWIEGQFKEMGYTVSRQSYEVKTQNVTIDGKPYYKDKLFHNIEAQMKGVNKADDVVILGAHYDTVHHSPGGDDNGSGVAVMLEVARRMAGEKCAKTIRFVAFTNEEPPFFHSEDMGSLVYAKMCKERNDRIKAMVCLDSVGYFTDEKKTQGYPIFLGSWLYGNRGDFLMFVSNMSSGSLTGRTAKIFRSKATINCQKAVFPNFVRQVGFSDQWSFWQMGYPAVMVTDTAFYRNNTYHTTGDTTANLDMGNLGRVAEGIVGVMRELAQSEKR
jgi:Zn-dependent M28 family amino/carboxypeptidase